MVLIMARGYVKQSIALFNMIRYALVICYFASWDLICSTQSAAERYSGVDCADPPGMS